MRKACAKRADANPGRMELSEANIVLDELARARWVRGPQSLVAGLALLALAALALWLTRNLDQGTLRAMGPAMLPRWLAIAVGLCGLALVAGAFVRIGVALERWSLRGPVFVVLARSEEHTS